MANKNINIEMNISDLNKLEEVLTIVNKVIEKECNCTCTLNIKVNQIF